VNGEVRGVLNVDSDIENAFSADDQELLEALAVQAFARDSQHMALRTIATEGAAVRGPWPT